MSDEAELKNHLSHVLDLVDDLFTILANHGSRKEFLTGLEAIEDDCRTIRATVIRRSRAMGVGIRANGQLDMRFNVNRAKLVGRQNGNRLPKPITSHGQTDLRFNQS